MRDIRRQMTAKLRKELVEQKRGGQEPPADVQAVIDVSRFTSTSNNTQSYNLVYPDGVDAAAVRVVRSSPSTMRAAESRMLPSAYASA